MEIQKLKEVEFYAAGVTAWYSTALEHDKSLFALSAGGIGLLTTLITTVGVLSTYDVALYIAAIISFLVCLVAVLVIFKQNRPHIERILAGHDEPDRMLVFFDSLAIYSFAVGALLSRAIGVSAAINSYTEKVKQMAIEKTKPTSSVPTFDSVNGISNLQPSMLETRSFNGIGAVRPQTGGAPASQSTSSPTTAVQPQVTTNAGNSTEK